MIVKAKNKYMAFILPPIIMYVLDYLTQTAAQTYIIMYITSIVFTLIAWGAGLLLDANIHFGDPQGFLCLRVLLPVLAMGLCLLRAIKENKRDGDK